jgi:poly-gamma-glutamate capsule biosynthesis protein CapA/YwtB (metallophosphatase superfamily)
MLYDAERGDISIAVVGDAMLSRRLRPFKEPNFLKLAELLRQTDVSVANLEFLFHNFEHPWQWTRGTYTRSDPKNLNELKWLGIDAVFAANNHSYDFSEGGYFTTLQHLDEMDIPHAGGGKDLDHARAPAYVDAPRGRVAIMSASSTFSEISRAGPGRPDFPGRPGINALRHQKVHHVPPDVFEALHKANRELGYEEHDEVQAQFGFSGRTKPLDKRTGLRFLEHEFHLAEGFKLETSVNKEDLEGIGKWIDGAKKQADWLVYGVHCHESGATGEFHGGSRTSPPDFLVEFAHWSIDRGCDLFAGHGPHFLRGIEIYKGAPIFYSLGNFIFQNETIDWVPYEGYRRFELGPEHTPGHFFEARSDAGKRGFPADPVFWQSVVGVCHYEGKALKEVRLYPIDMGFGRPIPQRGRPLLAEGRVAQETLEWLQHVSQPFGTHIDIEGDVGVIRL